MELEELDEYIRKIEKKNKNYRIIYGSRVSAENIQSALSLDYICYKEEFYLDWLKCVKYHEKNPFIYFMLLDKTGNVIGYINFSPITDKMYEYLKSGTVIDTVITSDDIMAYEVGNEYSAYFSSICVHPEYRHRGIARTLINVWNLFLVCLKKTDISIKRIVADSVSESGEKLLQSSGFSVKKTSNHNSKIMEKTKC